MGIDDAAEKHAQGLEAQLLGPAQFLVDGGMIIGDLAPHFNLIIGVGGDIIAPCQPRVLCIPLVDFFYRPSSGNRFSEHSWKTKKQTNDNQ